MAAIEGFSLIAAILTPSNVVTPSLDGFPCDFAGTANEPALAAAGESGLQNTKEEKKRKGIRRDMLELRKNIEEVFELGVDVYKEEGALLIGTGIQQ